MFHKDATLEIIGTQLLINYGSQKSSKGSDKKNIKVISMENLKEKDFLQKGE
jgi:hypothetical protein